MGQRKVWFVLAAVVIVAALGGFWIKRTGLRLPIGRSEPKADSLLNIPLDQTAAARQEFVLAYRKTRGRQAKALYEQFLPLIGANGLRLALETAKPFCHVEGHELGKLIYRKLRDVGQSLESCADACSSGCMHGVLMQFFTDTSAGGSTHNQQAEAQHSAPDSFAHQHSAQVTIADVARKIPTFCDSPEWKRTYGLGDCAHGVGHAAMFLSNYNAAAGMDLCDRFQSYPLRYYCATGGYMEYWVNPKSGLDSFRHGGFYPCESTHYPAACFKYLMPNTVRMHYAKGGTLETLASQCAALTQKYRLGCFHGIGFAHRAGIERGKYTLANVCGFGSREDQTMCLEGAMDQLGKFNVFVSPARCSSLADWRREVCQTVAARTKYDTARSFALFQR